MRRAQPLIDLRGLQAFIAVLPLPDSRLGRRDFFLLHRQGEWEDFASEIATLTRGVLDHGIRPALSRALPHLPGDALR